MGSDLHGGPVSPWPRRVRRLVRGCGLALATCLVAVLVSVAALLCAEALGPSGLLVVSLALAISAVVLYALRGIGPLAGTMMTHPGVYCLRSNQTDWDEATLWRTYFTLTDLEAVFRSLKSELGLRPIYHHKPVRADGHLFITVIAYQLVQVIRRRLRESGETASWTTLRRILEGQQRITATFRRADGRTLHVRKATRAEAPQQAIYDALGVNSAPGGIRKTIV